MEHFASAVVPRSNPHDGFAPEPHYGTYTSSMSPHLASEKFLDLPQTPQEVQPHALTRVCTCSLEFVN